MAFIEAVGLTKTFRRPDKGPGLAGSLRHLVARRFTEKVAVDHVNLAIGEGEAVAYVGPNGAGKSTTIKLLTGILVPSAGEVRVAGVVPHRDRTRNARTIGVLFGQRTQLWWDLPVRESLAVLRDVYGLDRATYERRLELFDDVLGLGELLPVMARRLSLGQRMRADLAAALLHSPRVVYLDEPTIGLDIAVKDRIRAFLLDLRVQGVTLMMTTHDLRDIEDVCQRLVIIDEGRIIFDGGLQEVKDRFAAHRSLHVQTATPLRPGRIAQALPEAHVEAPDGARAEASEFTIRFDRFALTAAQVLAALAPLSEVVDFRVDEPTIEDVVRRVYAGELTLDGGPDPAGARP